jgi:hypothetical protein
MRFIANIPAEEVEGHRGAQVVVDLLKHARLHCKNLSTGECAVGHHNQIVDARRVCVLILGGNKEARQPKELQLGARNWHYLQDAIENVHSQEHGLLNQLKPVVHLNKPVNKNGAHGGSDCGLCVHVARVDSKLDLKGR